MILTLIISITTVVLITLSILLFPSIKIGKVKIDTYWIIALIGALFLIIFRCVPIKEVYVEFTKDGAINPLKLLVLFFSMTILSIYLDEAGLFRFLASVAVKKAKGSQYSIFFILYFLSSILTVFTSNDVVILTLTPFICFFCKNSKINPLAYLISEFAAANTWSMMLLIGNPTNIYLASSANIDFLTYFRVMSVPTLCAGITELSIIFLLFRHQLKQKMEPCDVEEKIESRIDIFIGLLCLISCLICMVVSNYIRIGMWMIALIAATTLLALSLLIRLIQRKRWHYLYGSLKRLPYQLIPFILSMFVVAISLNYNGVLVEVAKFLNKGNSIIVYGFSSYITSNLINNIPMSIVFANLPIGLEDSRYLTSIFASIIGSNIGAFLTPLGALAGIMFTSLLKKYDVKMSFLDFSKYGIVISLPTISIALLLLSLFV